MSGLAGVLTGRHEPGVFLWHAAFDAAEVQHTVEHAGWTFGYVDGWVHQSKVEVLAAIGGALSFPDYYGKNLDALVDCLGDLDGVPHLQLCENRPFDDIDLGEVHRLVLEIGGLGDRMERTLSAGGDLF